MSVESVTQVETDLAVTQADTEVLRGVRLVWQKLQKLRQAALSDDKKVSAYRELLERGLAQARAQMAPVEEVSVEQKCREFWDWYEVQCRELGISELEQRRGRPHAEWSEKWLPEVYAAFSAAIGRVVDMPSQLHFDDARVKATALLKAYVGAIKGC